MSINEHIQTLLNFDAKRWPDNDLFPLNIKDEKRSVQQLINIDISDTTKYLIVTGFTSLSHIIEFFGRKVNFEKVKETKIILGFYPQVHKRKYWSIKDLPHEIKEEWLSKGVSLFHGGGTASIQIIEFIKSGNIKFKFSNKLHAKIYVSDSYAILGSSNFSRNGLLTQQEANIRVTKAVDGIYKEQYENIKTIGENFFEIGTDFTKEIIELLEQLLSVTSWQETLARAINELLEGNAFENDPDLLEKINNNNLWPSQKTALGRALNILQEQQNVLIAEPTGSGKTKVVSILNIILTHWLSKTGRRKLTQSLIICPPMVIDKWSKEFINLSFIQSSIISHGVLSSSIRKSYVDALQKIKIANLLVIDEAHNYLNNKSIRSCTISKSSADNIILATATPINKKANDLLRLIELLDVDNLTNDELKKFKELKALPFLKQQNHLKELEKFIWKFTVRRTKKELTDIIVKQPHKYKDVNGNFCKYPKHNKKIYTVTDTPIDREIAQQINYELQKLKGIINLQKFERYPDVHYEQITNYFDNRLKTAKALAIYKVQEALRSSKIALIEHIKGTDNVLDIYNFPITKKGILGVVANIKSLMKELPKFKNIPKELIPQWLSEIEEYRKICREEIQFYENIFSLAQKLSENREESKIDKIIELSKYNTKILAFDHIIITLDYLKHKLKEKNKEISVFVVTGGSSEAHRNKILDIFSLKAENEMRNRDFDNKKVVAFCSDSMSDSVDLQKSEYLIFLDMPSVLRIAEQRIGRIDRLDSPHKEITVFWPKDSAEFALKTDKKLIRTLDVTEALIGTNFELPDELLSIETSDYIKEFDKYVDKNESWEGVKDAYQSIYELYEGDNILLDRKYIDEFENIKTQVKCNLSIAKDENSWIFLALKGDIENPARWYFIEESEGTVFYDLETVTKKLREKLSNEKTEWVLEKKWIPAETDDYLNKYLKILQKNDKELLPNKKKRALEVSEVILWKIQKKLREKHKKVKSVDYYEQIQLIKELLEIYSPSDMIDNYSIDYNSFANSWLDIFVKPLDERKEKNKKWRKVFSIDDFKTSYSDLNLTDDILKEILSKIKYKEKIWNNVIACIIAIPNKKGL